MDKEKDQLRTEAQRALARGEWDKAFNQLKKYCAEDPKNLRSRQKMAELLERLDRKEEAVQEYRRLAENYAQEGYLLQAISINKIILRIDPSLTDVNERLAQLYTKKIQEPKTARPFPTVLLFSELNEQELRSLLSQVGSRTFRKDETICRQGDPGDSIMVISRGEVALFRWILKEKEIRIRNLKEGDSFGEFGFFTDQKRHATVKAVNDCEILEISRDALHEIIKAHPRIEGILSSLFKQRVLDLFLGASPLFASLSSIEREGISKRFRLLNLPEQTSIFQGGDPPGSLYLIKNGAVEIFIQKRHGERIVLATLESGSFFGEIGPLLNKPRMASAKTIRASELLELTKEDLESCLLQFPQIRSILQNISIRRLTRMNSEILSLKRTEKIRQGMV